jgi:hypothetical protein
MPFFGCFFPFLEPRYNQRMMNTQSKPDTEDGSSHRKNRKQLKARTIEILSSSGQDKSDI